jgi:nucleotide-binding universal stress UspA family protein
MKCILVATDGSSASAAAELEAVRLCADTGAELLVVHVWQEPGTWLGEPYYGRALERAQREARDVLARPIELADEAGVHATSELVVGRPPLALAELAETRDVDLVVVGAHRFGGLARFLLGSVSRAVLMDCSRPVLVVKEGTPIPELVAGRHAALAG